MSELTEMPKWVWDLLDAISDYEVEHPILYRLADAPGDDGKFGYDRAECFGAFLSWRKAWPPREVRDAAEFRRHILREHAANPAPPEPTMAEPATASELEESQHV